MKKILFICSSNICRSPYCEYVLKRLLEEHPKAAEKATCIGSSAVLNQSFKIHPKAVLALRREGFDDEYIYSHKPKFKWFDVKRFKEADVIVGMSMAHKRMTPLAFKKKFTTLSQLVGDEYAPVRDPYLMKDINDYYAVMDTLKNYLERYVAQLEQQN